MNIRAAMLAWLLAGAVAHGRLIAAYTAAPADVPPVMDGDLSDAVWARATPATAYFEYMKINPGPGALAGELRLAYDARGLYIAIRNREPHPERLRALRASNDPDLWMDDCSELYVDPSGQSVGYFCFTLNSIGSRTEYRRVDASVWDKEWTAEQARFATAVEKDAWTIEGFIPWSNLGRTGKAGDVWRFAQVRYAYTSGSFQGVTSSPEGSYQTPENFGYLVFTAGSGLTPEELGAQLRGRTAPPWEMVTESGVLACDAAGSVRHTPAAQWMNISFSRAVRMLDIAARAVEGSADPSLRAQVATLRESLRNAPRTASSIGILQGTRRFDEWREEARELIWKGRLSRVLSGRDDVPIVIEEKKP